MDRSILRSKRRRRKRLRESIGRSDKTFDFGGSSSGRIMGSNRKLRLSSKQEDRLLDVLDFAEDISIDRSSKRESKRETDETLFELPSLEEEDPFLGNVGSRFEGEETLLDAVDFADNVVSQREQLHKALSRVVRGIRRCKLYDASVRWMVFTLESRERDERLVSVYETVQRRRRSSILRRWTTVWILRWARLRRLEHVVGTNRQRRTCSNVLFFWEHRAKQHQRCYRAAKIVSSLRSRRSIRSTIDAWRRRTILISNSLVDKAEIFRRAHTLRRSLRRWHTRTGRPRNLSQATQAVRASRRYRIARNVVQTWQRRVSNAKNRYVVVKTHRRAHVMRRTIRTWRQRARCKWAHRAVTGERRRTHFRAWQLVFRRASKVTTRRSLFVVADAFDRWSALRCDRTSTAILNWRREVAALGRSLRRVRETRIMTLRECFAAWLALMVAKYDHKRKPPDLASK